ncbi:unnamed protein product [Protopolystoma xenopodis]|uniref:Uncharacterized protein n=1 Tax=Protopolystoma xenopodis TaxID=117903 RepID=A0A3S5AIW7_9PLAT|nr:unnamed protein product [Protopolystoma xenopodis]
MGCASGVSMAQNVALFMGPSHPQKFPLLSTPSRQDPKKRLEYQMAAPVSTPELAKLDEKNCPKGYYA